MVQPKQPPLSIRLGDVRLAKIDAYALKHGLKRHAAILELLDVALDGRLAVAASRPTPKPVPGSDAAKRKVVSAMEYHSDGPAKRFDAARTVQLGPTPAKPGSRLKGGEK